MNVGIAFVTGAIAMLTFCLLIDSAIKFGKEEVSKGKR